MKNFKLFLISVLLIATAVIMTSCAIPGLIQTCTVHRDLNKDTKCDVCGSYTPIVCVNHKDLNHDGMCDTTGCTITFQVFHYDLDHDGHCDEELCTKSNMRVNHVDDDYNRKCDECGKKITIDCECYDDDEDGYCDLCDYEIIPCEHFDDDEDGYCDECDEEIKEPCDECVDSDGDEKCDECGGKVEAPKVCEHTDGNFDGKCDLCKEAMTGVIQLYADKKSNFKFVLPANATSDTAYRVDMLIRDLKNFGITVEKGEDTVDGESEYEVIFGTPQNRADEYKLDGHDYGAKGYAVKLIGTKIIIVGGSDSTFLEAIDVFKETFLGITSSTRKLTTRYISEAQNVSEIQDDYDVSTITLLGQNIKGYTIAVDSKDKNTYPTATALQEMLYARTGYWLKIVPLEEADKSIVISMAKKDPEKEGFYATFTDGKMEFISEYPTVVQNKVITFFTTGLAAAKQSGTFAIEAKDSFVSDVRYVYYSDYGAKGDGYTDDSEAIRAAHTYANLGGHKVIAGDSKRYYIGKMETAISIKTDVDWGKCTFIIDDSEIAPLETIEGSTSTYRSVNIFTVTRDAWSNSQASADFALRIKEINAAGGIKAGEFTSFNVNMGQASLIYLNNGSHKNYVRYGVNASDGASQKEVFLLDENGNIDPTTPFMHDFEKITSYGIYQVDDEPITIEGGSFYTRPYLSDTPLNYTAYGRGIKCGRSNVTFKNVKHYIENEGKYDYNKHDTTTDYGCPYGGFFSTDYTNNVTYDNCQFAAHIVYKGSNGAGMGTYDLSPGSATNVVYVNCYQEDSNFFNASGQNRWGVMGSSYCKNVTFLDSKLTRFDAHNGIHNAFIINTEIKMIRINGTGTFVMENCIMHSNTLVGLREDYGGFWDGNIILKNNKMITTNGTINLFTNTWYNHYFGYPARYASNIIIDGLEVYKDKEMTTAGTPTINVFGSGILAGADKIVQDYLPVTKNSLPTYYEDNTPVLVANKCQATPPERVIIRNCENLATNIVLPSVAQYPWFTNTTFSFNTETECTQHFDWIPDGKCDDCGADFTPCTEHVDANNDGKCCFCSSLVDIHCDKHIDKELNAKCDICDAHYVCDLHIDADRNRICDKCGGVLGCKGAHYDADANGNCDVCTKLIPTCETCVDEKDNVYSRPEKDNKCDKCSAEMLHEGYPCATCVDEDESGYCDVCGGVIPSDEE